MKNLTLSELRNLQGEVEKKTCVDVKIVASMEDNFFKVTDSTTGLILSLDGKPHLTKDLAAGKFIRIINPMKIDSETFGVSSLSMIMKIPAFDAKELTDVPGNFYSLVVSFETL